MNDRRKLPSWMVATSVSTANQGHQNENSTKSNAEPNIDVPLLIYPGHVKYTCHKEECNEYCSELIQESMEGKIVVGFDIEWKVTYKTGDYKKTAVLQLCPSERKCFIFHLSMMRGFPGELRKLLESDLVLKVGLNIQGDADRLNVDYSMKTNGLMELSELANQTISNQEKWSLNGLLMNQLGFRLKKDERVRCSDWENFPLTAVQLQYAALDAYACLLLYSKLNMTS